MGERTSQRIVATAVLIIGFALAIGTWQLPDAPGYARVSARLFPGLIAGGLLLLGSLLLLQALRGGFRNVSEEAREPFHLGGFAWVSIGLIAHMALIAGIGFVLAATLLYVCAGRGFGSMRPARDAAVGFVIGAVVYVLFNYGLTLSLPWGAWIPGAPS
jgi:putative tricarboxylic transport membrane protein